MNSISVNINGGFMQFSKTVNFYPQRIDEPNGLALSGGANFLTFLVAALSALCRNDSTAFIVSLNIFAARNRGDSLV